MDNDGSDNGHDNSATTSVSIVAQFWSQIFLFAMTLGLSATVEFHHIRKQCTTRRGIYAIACGVLLQYTVMPVAGLFTVMMLHHYFSDDDDDHDDEGSSVSSWQFTTAMGLSVLILCCSPGGSYSTWWVAQCNADLALSVTMTTASSILGLLVLPFNLLLTTHFAYPNNKDNNENEKNGDDDTVHDQVNVMALLDFRSLLSSLTVVIAAIAMGMTLAYVMDQRQSSRVPSLSSSSSSSSTPSSSSCRWGGGNFHTWMNRLGNTSGLCLVVLGLVVGNHHDGEDPDDSNPSSSLLAQPWPLYAGVVLPFTVGLYLPHLVGRRWMGLSKPETVAVAIECCYQNK